MTREELVHTLGEALFADLSARRKGWAHAAVSARLENGSSETSGFAYDREGGHEGYAPQGFEIPELLEQLRDAMAAADGKEPWLACLLRLDRKTRDLAMEFEYRDIDRWQITFANSAERASQLRPVAAAPVPKKRRRRAAR